MHAPTPDTYHRLHFESTIVNLATLAHPSSSSQLKISDLIRDKIKAQEHFFGLEISPGLSQTLNYNLFKVAPLFTSIVWIATQNWSPENIDDPPALKLAKRVEPSGPVLSHLSCQNLTYERLQRFLNPTVKNVMVIRGDIVNEEQLYRHAAELVREIRHLRKDDVCISVGGYPEGHPESTSRNDDLRYLKEKIDAGADLLITQLTFNEDALINFVRDCRAIGITIPILPGIYVPKSWSSYQFISNLTNVQAPKEVYDEFVKRKDDHKEFREYARQQATKMIRKLFESDLGIYGVQFFTMNYFKNIESIVRDVI